MDPVARFAEQADAFARWLDSGTDRGVEAARAGLIRLLDLYRAGLELPPESACEVDDRAEVERVDEREWRRVVESTRRLPFDLYGEVFDPTAFPPEEPVIGSLADDLADIYRDVVTGLRAYRQGRRDEAVWEWSFGMRTHWGGHATGAIRALHAWITQDHPGR